jgi:hypothetical protein
VEFTKRLQGISIEEVGGEGTIGKFWTIQGREITHIIGGIRFKELEVD